MELSDHQAKTAAQPHYPSTTGTQLPHQFDAPGRDHVKLIKTSRRWSYAQGLRLENNLYRAVGFLELANAGDFAANVWNEIPVPIYAVVFMVIGGTVAGVMCLFAFGDSGRAWSNIKFLRKQKETLLEEKIRLDAELLPSLHVDVLVEITTRELRIEFINRWAMDILMGAGAVLISIGTFMAIGGANRKVWFASNILSGYLGNAPITLFGLISSVWAAYMWRKMHSHKAAAREKLQGSPALALVKRRCFNVQLFYVINGMATVTGGVGSMITAERWWGYVILIPVIISSIFCNVWWRKRVGYRRPYITNPGTITTEVLLDAIESSTRLIKIVGESGTLAQLVSEPSSLRNVLAFFAEHDLFEELCLRLMEDKRVGHLLCSSTGTLELTVPSILSLPELNHSQIIVVAEEFLMDDGERYFVERERFLVEVLGVWLGRERKIQQGENR